MMDLSALVAFAVLSAFTALAIVATVSIRQYTRERRGIL